MKLELMLVQDPNCPCDTSVFTINSLRADLRWFGTMATHPNPQQNSLVLLSCSDNLFTPKPVDEVQQILQQQSNPFYAMLSVRDIRTIQQTLGNVMKVAYCEKCKEQLKGG